MPVRLAAMLLTFCIWTAQAADAPPTLTGSWTGRWTDSRPGYTPNGGDFTCVAVEKEPGVWNAVFMLGKTQTFKAELKGTLVGSQLRFDTSASLGKFHGMYTLKGQIEGGIFTANYEGRDERGTFKMTRTATARERP